jgi:hypothetical protein
MSQWELAVAVATSSLLALGSWMFMVHAKLAVIASRIVALSEQMQRAADTNQELWLLYARHEARLETHNVQLTHVAERLKEL